jgi:hypothetical protein
MQRPLEKTAIRKMRVLNIFATKCKGSVIEGRSGIRDVRRAMAKARRRWRMIIYM